MYKISKENRDALTLYLDKSGLPHVDVIAMLKMLGSLEQIKDVIPEVAQNETK